MLITTKPINMALKKILTKTEINRKKKNFGITNASCTGFRKNIAKH